MLPDEDPPGTLGGLNSSGSAAEELGEPNARTRLREAALQRFGRQGVHATSTREIIADAGLRNPSAITYYFGSKANLVDDLIREVNLDRSAIIQRQVALAQQPGGATPREWAATAIDAAQTLLESERGRLLIRVWAEHDDANPDAVEEFLAGDHGLARSWRAAVASTFPNLPPVVAIARNVIVLRTLQWITVRRARRIVEGAHPKWATDPPSTRPFLIELVLNILTPPTSLTDAQMFDS
jgi:AcrR family transcriptional regulator